MLVASSPWAPLRFRRSKDLKGWTLLGLAEPLYLEVIQLLFEQQARLLKKDERGEFVNLLFESPEALAVELALAFPAPPGCEQIVINPASDRLLPDLPSRPATQARLQLKASVAEARLSLLSGHETFAQVLEILANANRRSQPALPRLGKAEMPQSVVAAALLDEEGFETDEWQEERAERSEEETSAEEEVFDDVWETEEPTDFGHSASGSVPVGARAQLLAAQQAPIVQAAVFQQTEIVGAIAQPVQQQVRRRIELPFERLNDYASDTEEWRRTPTGLSRPHSSQRLQLPEESWAATAEMDREDWPVAEPYFPAEEKADHRYVLSQGVAIWNEWRRANPHIRPTLRGAYLNNLNLAGADFRGVDLCFAFLFRADLRAANLSSALLLGADLIRSDLGGASLWGAILEGAYLSYANLAGADLTQANLQDAYWQGAILEGATLPNGRPFEAYYS